MAEKLSITIALNGAEEIKRQLAEVGKAGQQAFADINQAAAEVGGFNKLDPGVVGEKLKAAGVTGSKAINKINTAVKQAGRMETLVNGIRAVESGFVAAGNAISGMGAALTAFIPSARTLAKIVLAAFSAATVGAIINTTKALRELDAAAIKAGLSVETMGKARQIFEAIGLSSKSAADAVASFNDKITLDNVKKAIANIDEFGRVTDTSVNSIKILEETAKGTGEAADLAAKKLLEMGRIRISGAAQEIDRINQSAQSLPDKILAIIAVLEQMGPTAERNRIAGKLFGPEFVQALNAGGVELEKLKAKLLAMPGATQGAVNAATRVALAWENLKTALAAPFVPSEGTLNFIADVLNAIANLRQTAQADLAAIGQFFSNLAQSAASAAQSILSFFSSLPGQIAGFFSGLGAGLWDGLVQGAAAAWDKIIGFIDAAIQRVKQFIGMGGGAAGAGAGGMARGGIMGGRGTGTSDSNLAWLSRGEHVMPAYAVRQPGVLQLLEALRRSGGNLRGVLDRMGHFALGGMVSAPAFARGGVVGGMSNVTIQFPGVAPITGLRASGAVVDELRRAAALAQVRSGGRKPSRYS